MNFQELVAKLNKSSYFKALLIILTFLASVYTTSSFLQNVINKNSGTDLKSLTQEKEVHNLSSSNITATPFSTVEVLFLILCLIVIAYLIFKQKSKMKNLAKTTTLRLEKQEKRMRYLYEIIKKQEADKNELLDSVIQDLTISLQMDIGVIFQMDKNTYSVLHSFVQKEDMDKEKILQIGKTCCGITFYAKDIVSIDQMEASVFNEHPCYKTCKVKSYLGTLLTVGGKKFGTLNFLGFKPQVNGISQTDRDFVQLIGRLIEIVLENKQTEEKMKETNTELEWLNKIKIGRELRMIELKDQISKLNKKLGEVSGKKSE
ncbi:MAG: hypothetical protein A2857_06550 [Candidatus Levybacteria bacterium RIFCSPHIGHO2_01_FULL_36_15]|nr:MAG: hypothetical protein A2857_06550 [Candidatus Levybacteria bacterium RIFCSPHIGHO2_01_FULL_36_15]OGH38819.1 MAG: hypothetical protein A2905_02565 [Candidatus Levybacteria bacterium RIFCSPLOWO2_01_FULL_36_10]